MIYSLDTADNAEKKYVQTSQGFAEMVTFVQVEMQQLHAKLVQTKVSMCKKLE